MARYSSGAHDQSELLPEVQVGKEKSQGFCHSAHEQWPSHTHTNKPALGFCRSAHVQWPSHTHRQAYIDNVGGLTIIKTLPGVMMRWCGVTWIPSSTCMLQLLLLAVQPLVPCRRVSCRQASCHGYTISGSPSSQTWCLEHWGHSGQSAGRSMVQMNQLLIPKPKQEF